MNKIILLGLGMFFSINILAKDIKTVVVTTQPLMHCENCENRIKGNLRFEKGIKKIETSIEKQQVTITYDADKTKPENIINSFEKFGYKATEVDNTKSNVNVDDASGQNMK